MVIILLKYSLAILFWCSCLLGAKSQDLIPFRANDQWGFKDRQGVIKIQPQFQYASRFIYDMAVVAKNDSLGAINTSNTVIIPFKYHLLKPLSATEFLFGYKAKYFGEYFMGVLTKEGKTKIPARYSSISQRNGLYVVMQQQDSIITTDATGDTRWVGSIYGLHNEDGSVLLPCQYSNISWKNDTLIDLTKDVEGMNHALFNHKGEQLSDFGYMVFAELVEGMIKTRIADRYGFLSPDGKIAIPIKFEYCEDFNNGHAMIRQMDKWGAINKMGKIIVEPTFDYQQVKSILKARQGK
jgi:hypothetical protein